MNGMNASTGQPLDGAEHIAQSIGDILSTPLGSRVMRRDYGSLLFELLDKPINSAMLLLLKAATAIALARWEPRIRLTQVTLDGVPQNGNLRIRIQGRRLDVPAANALSTFTIPIETNRASAPAT